MNRRFPRWLASTAARLTKFSSPPIEGVDPARHFLLLCASFQVDDLEKDGHRGTPFPRDPKVEIVHADVEPFSDLRVAVVVDYVGMSRSNSTASWFELLCSGCRRPVFLKPA